jgi:cytochrome c oxidase subunit IV
MGRTPHTFTGGSHHIMPKKIYFIIFAALLVGTAVTVQAAFVDLGPLNTVVALAIAVVKATLVVLFFMHVKYSSRLTKLVVAGGLVWLVILFGLTMEDYLSRKWIPHPGSWETPAGLGTEPTATHMTPTADSSHTADPAH